MGKIFLFSTVTTALVCFCGCSDNLPRTEQTAAASNLSASVTVSPEPPKLPCPVKLVRPRMVHNLEEDVYATVVNISDSDIAAIAFGAAHTDKLGQTRTPYRTDLTSEDTIRRRNSRSLHWEVLMEEPSSAHMKPGTSELYVTKLAFTDGRTFDITQIEGCSFDF